MRATAINLPHSQTRRPLHVRSHADAAHYVDVAMGLALHGIPAKVGQESEPAGALLRTYLRSHLGDLGDDGVLPQLFLAVMLLWYRQQHYRHPSKPVAEHHHIIIFKENLARLPSGHDLTEDAGGNGQSALLVNCLSGPYDTFRSRFSVAPRCPDSLARLWAPP